MKRRNFIIGVTGAAAALAAAHFIPFRRSKRSWLVIGSPNRFHRLPIHTETADEVEVSCTPHSFTTVPGDSNLILGIEKSGPRMTLVDFSAAKSIRDIPAPTNRNYYGHICWKPDGGGFYSTQVNQRTGMGYLVLYDRNFKIQNEFELTPGGVHDLAWMPGDKVLAITTAGVVYSSDGSEFTAHGKRVQPSRLVFFDTEKNAIIQQWELSDPSLIVGHLKIGSDGRVYMISTLFPDYDGPRTPAGSIYEASLTSSIKEWKMPTEVRQSLKDELLSIEINEKKDLLIATNPKGNRLLEYDLHGNFLRSIDYFSNGIAWDKDGEHLFGIGRHEQNVALAKCTLNELEFLLPPSSHCLLVEEG